VPAELAPALRWVAMASAIVTKLPLNMSYPGQWSCLPGIKTRGKRSIRQRRRAFGSVRAWNRSLVARLSRAADR
jgi:hypothetical protein